MTPATLNDLLQQAGLGRSAEAVSGLARESLRLKAKPSEAGGALGASRLGGLPDLPAGLAWPAWNDTPLAFLAQLRLPDLRRHAAAGPLPKAGLLSFFYDARQQVYGDQPTDRGAWQVLYFPEDVVQTLQSRPAPREMPDASRFRPCAVELEPEWTLPQNPDFFRQDLGWTSDEQDRYDQLLFEHLSDRRSPRHRLLGHADVIQDDMHVQCQLNANGVAASGDPRAAALLPGASNWQLLLQLDSDAGPGLRWGNAGMIYFWIEAGALAAGRFDNVWMALQSE